MSAVGRIGYSLKERPDVLTFQDYDVLTLDLAAGEIRFERNGQRSGLVISAIAYLDAQIPGLGWIGTKVAPPYRGAS